MKLINTSKAPGAIGPYVQGYYLWGGSARAAPGVFLLQAHVIRRISHARINGTHPSGYAPGSGRHRTRCHRFCCFYRP